MFCEHVPRHSDARSCARHCLAQLRCVFLEVPSREVGVKGNEEFFDKFIDDILTYGGKMAKVMESTDHMESGNPRAEMSDLIPKLFLALLGYVTPLGIDVEESMAARFKKIEGSFVL